MTNLEPVAKDRLLPEKGVLDTSLLMGSRFLPPPATPDLP
jgi:hypothetical protein